MKNVYQLLRCFSVLFFFSLFFTSAALATECDDQDPTTIDVIDKDGNCLHFKKVCDDGDPQTRDYFDAEGNCVSELIVCDDDDPETEDYLDNQGVCHHIRTIVEECDECPDDPDKDKPGICGCGNPEPGAPCDDGNPKTIDDRITDNCECKGILDTDGDGFVDDEDNCPTDPNKTEPGDCGCGNPEPGTSCDDGDDCTVNDTIDESCECKGIIKDSDGDGTIDCEDNCPDDPRKTEPGQCGCGVNEIDPDGDGIFECEDMCPDDPNKLKPGECGCGNPDTDTDGDGTADCNDWCPDDPNKTEDGQCGCGNPETDTDGDGTPDCNDWCPDDPNKTEDGQCGCGNPDPGTPCDDGDDCTIDDRITENCECRGVPKDTPECRGETCIQEIGEPCDDGNDCTINDVITEDCECRGTPKDTDRDGTPDCDDRCPEDPSNFCEECPSDLEGCSSYINFISCDQVIVCLGKDISNIVVDLGPTGFQSYQLDVKFDGLSGKRWTYTAPEGEIINGVWVKTADFCGKCSDDEERYGCVDCEGDACPQGAGAGPYYRNEHDCRCDYTPGTPCDDNNPWTVNDVITADCECVGRLDTDEDGVPDDEDICPEDPEDNCEECTAELASCEVAVNFLACNKVIVCAAEDIDNIVVDLGEAGFQNFEIDPKFDDIQGARWEYVVPAGTQINGLWIKTGEDCVACDPSGWEDEEIILCPEGDNAGPYYLNDQHCDNPCEDEKDSDGDGRPDCIDICPLDPSPRCEVCPDGLEGCDTHVAFPACNRVVVCSGERISQIVLDMGPTGFQKFSVDPKFAGIQNDYWTYIAPEGQTINGVWVKTKGFCDKCGEEDEFSCVDCEGDACPRGDGGGRYYRNISEECVDNIRSPIDPDIELNLFPNPTSQELFVKIRNRINQTGSVQVVNTNGDRIYQMEIDPLNGDDLRIDLGNAPRGLYFLRIILNDGAVLTKQFVLAE